MQGFESRLARLELKYVIDELGAWQVLRDIQPYCRPDPHNLDHGTSPGFGYLIQSLYLDTPGLAFHESKERGDSERLKLRLRRYEASGTTLLELKERSLDVIEKRRAVIETQDLEEAAHGYAKLREETAPARDFIDRFARVVMESGAEPVLLVRYRREAYQSHSDDYARVTFDRDLEYQRVSDWRMDADPYGWCRLDEHLVPAAAQPLVVLEMKCTTAVPHWILDVIRANDLKRCSFSKYSIGIHLTRRLGGSPASGRSLRGVLC